MPLPTTSLLSILPSEPYMLYFAFFFHLPLLVLSSAYLRKGSLRGGVPLPPPPPPPPLAEKGLQSQPLFFLSFFFLELLASNSHFCFHLLKRTPSSKNMLTSYTPVSMLNHFLISPNPNFFLCPNPWSATIPIPLLVKTGIEIARSTSDILSLD